MNDKEVDLDDQIAIKLVLLGDGGVGKTSLRKRYMGESFSRDYLITLGADFALKNVNIEGQSTKFQIWDLSGQQRFEFIRALYYKSTQGALIVFDVTRPDSFENCQGWISELITHNDNRVVPMILIGNKVDLTEERVISSEQGKDFAKQISNTIFKGFGFDVPYLEASALSGANVDEAFDLLGKRVLAHISQ